MIPELSFLNLQLILYNRSQVSGPYCYTSPTTKTATAILPLLKGLNTTNSECQDPLNNFRSV